MASTTQAQGKLLDYEQFIDHQLGLTRARIKMTDVLTALVLLIAAVTGVLFTEVVLDHAFGLPFWLRQIILVVGLSGAITFTLMRIARPMLLRVNSLYAAKTIETSDTTFKNSLINYLELRKHRGEMSSRALAAIEAKAVDDLTKVEVEAVVNQKRLIQEVYVLAGLVVAFCLYSLITPKPILDSIKRAFLSDVARPTNTRLVNIKPGDDPKASRVVASANVTFSTEVQGARPRAVTLHVSTDGGKHFLAREMKQKGGNDYAPWIHPEANVQQATEYYFTAEDAVSRTYHLDVLPKPMVVEMKHDLEFPRYTRVAPRKDVDGGNVEAIEGTIVTLHARTNEPAEAAWMLMARPSTKNPSQSDWATADKIAMTVSESDAYALEGKFQVKFTGQYKIHFKTTGGQENDNAVFLDVTAHKDKPPLAQVVRPERPAIKAPSNAKVPLRLKATDDFGVKEATLHVQQKNEILQPAKNYLERQEPPREFAQDDALDLAALRVKPGATVEYWLTVRDTREPQANKVETQHQTIEVIEPASKQELEKIDKENQKANEPPPADQPDTSPPDAAKKDQANPNKDQKTKEKGDSSDGKGGDSKNAVANDQDNGANPPKDQPDRPMTAKEKEQLAKLQKAMDQQKPRPNNNANPQGGSGASAPQDQVQKPQKPQDGANGNPNSKPQDGNPNATPPNAKPTKPGETPPNPSSNGSNGADQAPVDRVQKPRDKDTSKGNDSPPSNAMPPQKPGDPQKPQPSGAKDQATSSKSDGQAGADGQGSKPGDPKGSKPEKDTGAKPADSPSAKPGDPSGTKPSDPKKPQDAKPNDATGAKSPDAKGNTGGKPGDPSKDQGGKPSDPKKPNETPSGKTSDASKAADSQAAKPGDPKANPDRKPGDPGASPGDKTQGAKPGDPKNASGTKPSDPKDGAKPGDNASNGAKPADPQESPGQADRPEGRPGCPERREARRPDQAQRGRLADASGLEADRRHEAGRSLEGQGRRRLQGHRRQERRPQGPGQRAERSQESARRQAGRPEIRQARRSRRQAVRREGRCRREGSKARRRGCQAFRRCRR